jgi:chromosomal replication initiation ATPase DnaA
LISDRIEFALRVVFAEADAAKRRASKRTRRRRSLLPKPIPLHVLHRALAYRDIVQATAERHGMSVAELTGTRGDDPVCDARFEAMWLIRNCSSDQPASYAVVAAALGRSDHTTAISGVRRFEDRLRRDPSLRDRLLGGLADRRAA